MLGEPLNDQLQSHNLITFALAKNNKSNLYHVCELFVFLMGVLLLHG
jgi:hypothetical protein